MVPIATVFSSPLLASTAFVGAFQGVLEAYDITPDTFMSEPQRLLDEVIQADDKPLTQYHAVLQVNQLIRAQMGPVEPMPAEITEALRLRTFGQLGDVQFVDRYCEAAVAVMVRGAEQATGAQIPLSDYERLLNSPDPSANYVAIVDLPHQLSRQPEQERLSWILPIISQLAKLATSYPKRGVTTRLVDGTQMEKWRRIVSYTEPVLPRILPLLDAGDSLKLSLAIVSQLMTHEHMKVRAVGNGLLHTIINSKVLSRHELFPLWEAALALLRGEELSPGYASLYLLGYLQQAMPKEIRAKIASEVAYCIAQKGPRFFEPNLDFQRNECTVLRGILGASPDADLQRTVLAVASSAPA